MTETKTEAMSWDKVEVQARWSAVDRDRSYVSDYESPRRFPAEGRRMAGTEAGFLVLIGSVEDPGVMPGDRLRWGKLYLDAVLPSYPAPDELGPGYTRNRWAVECRADNLP